jgi:hypothetical protein
MDIASIFLGLALLFLVLFVVARPLVEGQGIRERKPGPIDELLFERERILLALRDLDFDYATGKLVDEDYTGPRAELVARGAEVLRQLDALGAGPGARSGADLEEDEIERAIAARRARPQPAAPAPADDDIEAAVAARRIRPTAPAAERRAARDAAGTDGAAHQAATAERACAECGTPARPGAVFCAVCGAALPLACANCGQPAAANDRFCSHCGQPIGPTAGDPRQVEAGR